MGEIALFKEVEEALALMTADRVVKPPQEPLRGVKKFGPATDRIKKLYALYHILGEEIAALDRALRQDGLTGNRLKFREINQKNLRQRVTAIALGDEVSREFDSYGERFGIDWNWEVYAQP